MLNQGREWKDWGKKNEGTKTKRFVVEHKVQEKHAIRTYFIALMR